MLGVDVLKVYKLRYKPVLSEWNLLISNIFLMTLSSGLNFARRRVLPFSMLRGNW